MKTLQQYLGLAIFICLPLHLFPANFLSATVFR